MLTWINRNRRRIGIILGIAALLAILGFVWGNSMLSKQESAEVSSSVKDALAGVLRPVAEWIAGGEVSDDLLHKIVRKGAHFIEFAALSFCFTGLLRLLCGTWRTHAIGYVLFLSLLCGVLDEFLQSFTGRGTSVRDVMLDFCGALIGIALAIAAIELFEWIRKRRRE